MLHPQKLCMRYSPCTTKTLAHWLLQGRQSIQNKTHSFILQEAIEPSKSILVSSHEAFKWPMEYVRPCDAHIQNPSSHMVCRTWAATYTSNCSSGYAFVHAKSEHEGQPPSMCLVFRWECSIDVDVLLTAICQRVACFGLLISRNMINHNYYKMQCKRKRIDTRSKFCDEVILDKANDCWYQLSYGSILPSWSSVAVRCACPHDWHRTLTPMHIKFERAKPRVCMFSNTFVGIPKCEHH